MIFLLCSKNSLLPSKCQLLTPRLQQLNPFGAKFKVAVTSRNFTPSLFKYTGALSDYPFPCYWKGM